MASVAKWRLKGFSSVAARGASTDTIRARVCLRRGWECWLAVGIKLGLASQQNFSFVIFHAGCDYWCRYFRIKTVNSLSLMYLTLNLLTWSHCDSNVARCLPTEWLSWGLLLAAPGKFMSCMQYVSQLLPSQWVNAKNLTLVATTLAYVLFCGVSLQILIDDGGHWRYKYWRISHLQTRSLKSVSFRQQR